MFKPLNEPEQTQKNRQESQLPVRTNQTPNALSPLPGFPFRSQHTRLNHKYTRNSNPAHMKCLISSTVSSIITPLSMKLTVLNYNKASYYYIGKLKKKKKREHIN